MRSSRERACSLIVMSHPVFKRNRMHNYIYTRIKFRTYSDVIMENEQQCHVKETYNTKRLSEMYNFFWKRRLHTSQAIDQGLRIRLELSNIFNFIASFFSERCWYSKGEHMSYSADILEINDMQGLKQGKRLAK